MINRPDRSRSRTDPAFSVGIRSAVTAYHDIGDDMRFLLLTRRRLAILFSCVLIGAAALVVASSTAGRIAATMNEEREIPIYYVGTDEKVCALSFDAAWGNEQTAGLLDTLDNYDVKSTFFLVSQWVEKYPDDVKEIAARGHDVGNHSTTHPHMAALTSGGDPLLQRSDRGAHRHCSHPVPCAVRRV